MIRELKDCPWSTCALLEHLRTPKALNVLPTRLPGGLSFSHAGYYTERKYLLHGRYPAPGELPS